MGADFVHEIDVPASRARLLEFLSDLHHHLPLHPLIVSIEDLPPDPEMPGARRYRVLDRIPMGPLRLRARYVAALEPLSEHEIHGHAWQWPGIHLHTIYVLEAHGPSTHLVERVRVEAPRLLRRFVTSQARQAHRETLEKLKALFESEH